MLASIAAYCWFFCSMFLCQIHYYGNNAPANPKTTKTAAKPTAAKPAVVRNQKNDAPKVFLISEDQANFEQLSAQYNSGLIEVCKDDMDAAYAKWTNMMHAFEQHAEKNNVQIKGVKLWVKVFWSPDGTVDHVAYSLKSISRNVQTDHFTALWKTFIDKYKLPLDGTAPSAKFSHYGSVSFPLYMR